MTTITITRPPGVRAVSVEKIRLALVSRLHTQVKIARPHFCDDGSMSITLAVEQDANLVRAACAAVVHEPVRAEVSS